MMLYVYGIVRSDFDTKGAPAGLDDTSVGTRAFGTMAALVSELPDASYDPAMVERESADVSWLSPRAMAHDRVLTWAQDHGGVVPVPMFSLWAGEPSLVSAMSQRQDEFAATFDRVRDADEYGLRVHRRDAEMMQSIASMDEEIGTLQREAEAASPGQRYLLERKLSDQKRTAVRRAGQAMARALFDKLHSLSREAVALPIAPVKDAAVDGTMVLNAAFLVDRAQLDAFRTALGAELSRLEATGLRFDFTGPWPPYNFSGARRE